MAGISGLKASTKDVSASRERMGYALDIFSMNYDNNRSRVGL